MDERATADMFDLSPDPRILPMLGEINLAQWRCIAELVDNSIDSFVAARRAENPIDHPEVSISLPTQDDARAKVTVRDNATGMDGPMLERAVRAGWSGNDPIHNLGLFGMGFNIATARLGNITRVWTTRKGDAEWCGLEIDFDALARQKNFRTPKLTRPKLDRNEHGTEISIARLKPEQRAWLARAANRSKVQRELGRVYSAMLRPNGLPLSFDLNLHNVVRGRQHCVWDESRSVNHVRFGQVHAVLPFDVTLDDRPFCTQCWQWLSAGEQECASCSSSDGVVARPRRVHGWLGIQRYLHEAEYGIDFIRHGRKIELENKDLFSWSSDDGIPELEYPVDDPRHRGRIVGEVHTLLRALVQ